MMKERHIEKEKEEREEERKRERDKVTKSFSCSTHGKEELWGRRGRLTVFI